MFKRDGAPPIMCRHGWLMLYHDVHDLPEPGRIGRKMCYSAGAMVLSNQHPNKIIYRLPEPALVPGHPLECHGTVDDVVFPTGIDLSERCIAGFAVAWRLKAEFISAI